MYVEHYGMLKVRNHTTNEVCEVEFKKRGWSGKDAFKIEGHAIDSNNEKRYKIWGTWIDNIKIQSMEPGASEE